MKRFDVVASPRAEYDLRDIHRWVAARAGKRTADRYLRRINDLLRSLEYVPERGRGFDEVMPGLRVIGMERRVNIVFRIDGSRVLILRILSGGQDVAHQLRPDQN